jgi:hypothetical protein
MQTNRLFIHRRLSVACVAVSALLYGTVGETLELPQPPVEYRGHILGYIETSGGFILSATNGGGIGGPDNGPSVAALHTDARQAGPWEAFTLIVLDDTHFALKTADGHYVTAVNAGGMGSSSSTAQPLTTDLKAGAQTRAQLFTLSQANPPYGYPLPNGKLRPSPPPVTPSGAGMTINMTISGAYFVTAVNAGGIGEAANTTPIHTNATALGPWETFTWIPQTESVPVACPPDGCAHGGTANSPTCILNNSLKLWNEACSVQY